MRVDSAWAGQRLEEYLALCDAITSWQRRNGGAWDDECSRINDQAELRIATVEKIVRAVYPPAPALLMTPNYPTQNSEQYVRRALGALKDQVEVEDRLKPTSPVILADRLHPKIWAAAAPVWDTGEFRAAIQQACLTLSAHIRAKAGSPLRDRRLAAEVFSPDQPRNDRPRLHLPGDPSDEAWQARQQGLHHLAQGAFAGIRNVAAHEEEGFAEQEALELLAVLSTVARWCDATQLRTSSPPESGSNLRPPADHA